MKTCRIAWALALFALPAWALAAETPAKFSSYRDVEAAYQSQSAELHELRARLASLEQEVVHSGPPQASYVDDGYFPGHYGPSDCCTTCEADVCCCQPCGMFYAGAEIVWLKPHFHSADAFFVDGPNSTTFVPFNYDFEISPRFWLGYQNAHGTGGRVRYWQWEHLAASAAVEAGPGLLPGIGAEFSGFFPVIYNGITNAQSAASFHALDLETIDFEVTRDLCIGHSILRVAAGLRYLDLGQRFGATLTGGGNETLASLLYSQDFEGLGPTFALELGHDLGCCFSFYATARGSVVFGNRSDRIDYSEFGASPAYAVRARADEMISIGEIGMGLESNFGCVFARVGYEGQIWWDAGSPNTGLGNMGLHGFSITGGVMF